MRQRHWEGADINKAFFDIETKPIAWVDDCGQTHEISKQKAIVNTLTEETLAVVSDKYHVLHNRDAFQLADYVIRKVFMGKTLEDFVCFNVRLAQSMASCMIDLIIPNSFESPFGDRNEDWTPFLRISNSYNRRLVLRYEIGFCRWICLNGVISSSGNVITISVDHNSRIYLEDIASQIRSQSKINDINHLWEKFEKKLHVLRSTAIPQSMSLPMFCKAFNLKVEKEKLSERQKAALRRKAGKIIHDAREYFGEMGNNAYAMFNVLTDYATFPEGLSRRSTFIHGYQKKVSIWADELVEAVNHGEFSLDDFIGKEAMDSALFLESLIQD